MEPTHYRCAHRIQEIPVLGEPGNVTDYPSINAAKRASRKLGLGKCAVVTRLKNIGTVTKQYKAKSEHDTKAKPMPSAA